MANNFRVSFCFPASQSFQVSSAITHDPYGILNKLLISGKKEILLSSVASTKPVCVMLVEKHVIVSRC